MYTILITVSCSSVAQCVFIIYLWCKLYNDPNEKSIVKYEVATAYPTASAPELK